nr:ead/Ea22-like family protein [Escherichia coli]
MSEIDYQALREAAERATPAMERLLMLPVDDDLLSEQELKDYGVDIDALNAFKFLTGPETVLALLDERERNQQYIKRRDQENEDIALTVGKLRVELEAEKKRTAELEAEPVSQTYKLNELSGNSPVTPDGLSTVCAEAYQVVGVMADALGVFGDAAVQKVLDNLSQQKLVHRDVLPFSLPVTPDGWISCSERMPEDTKMLLAFSQGQIVAAYWNWVMSPIDYKKYRAFTYLSGNILDDVTHWMPLPEPPEQDGE